MGSASHFTCRKRRVWRFVVRREERRRPPVVFSIPAGAAVAVAALRRICGDCGESSGGLSRSW